MKYRPEIDGLRALAVLPVVLYHAGYQAFAGGFVGVDVFFVISGYLITSLIMKDLNEHRFSIAVFYERRARRILPALFLVMLVSLPFAWMWMMPSHLEEYLRSLLATLLFLSNFFFWDQTGYFDTAAELKPMLHTWSLAVEEQFYIFFPLVLIALWRFEKRTVVTAMIALFAISFWLAQWGVQNDPATAFFLLPARVWELLAGALIAFYGPARPRGQAEKLSGPLAIVGLLLIVSPVFIFDERTAFPGANAIPAVLGTTLVVTFANGSNLVGRLLSTRLFVSIGLVSYSLYLWHQPIFALVRHRFGKQIFDENVIWLIALSVCLATASLWLVERPFRYRASVKQLAVSMGGFAFAIIATGLWIDAEMGRDLNNVPSYARASQNAPKEIIAYSEGRETHMPCTGNAVEYGFSYCDFGEPSAKKAIAVWGDSFAGSLLFGIDDVAKRIGTGGVLYVADGCPPVLGLSNSRSSNCTEHTHAEILQRILKQPDVDTLLIIGNFEGAAHVSNVSINGETASMNAIKTQIATAVSIIHAASRIKVYLVQQGPTFAEPVASSFIENISRDDYEFQEIPRQEHTAIVSTQDGLADVTDGHLKTIDFFCNEKTCPSFDPSGQMIIYDRNHLTKAYSVLFAKELLDQVFSMSETGVPKH